MKPFSRDFIELALGCEALSFGEYTLKSGRVSPYFFNAGRFDSGAALAGLGRCYADAIADSQVNFDLIFGPAYKGIPLAAATACALSEHHGRDLPWAFNRKEAKDHGEGGAIVGAPLGDRRVLIVDDVITAGTAVREVLRILKAAGAEPAGLVIGLNRQERGVGEVSAIDELQREHGLPVVSIAALDDIVQYLRSDDDAKARLAAVEAYRARYGV